MGSDVFGLTPINLALDGTVGQFYDLYFSVYECYRNSLKRYANNSTDSKEFKERIIPEILPLMEAVAVEQLDIFDDDLESVRFQISDFKYFDFFDNDKIK